MAEANYSKEKKGLYVTSKGGSANIRQGVGTYSKAIINIKKGELAGRLTGQYNSMSDGDWYHVELEGRPGGHHYGYIREDVAEFLTKKQWKELEGKGKKLIDKLVENDIEIFHTLIISANLIQGLKNRGANTLSYEKEHDKLVKRHAERQDKIKTSKALKWKTGLKKGYQKLRDKYIEYLKKTYGLGAVPVIAVIVGVAIGAGLSAAAYFAFRPAYDESKQDLVISKDLEKALENIDPETKQKVLSDLEGQVDVAYRRGEERGKFSGVFGTIKILAFAVLGYLAVTKVMDYQKSRKR